MKVIDYQVTVLVCLGYHNKVPETGWLKEQKFISHGSGGWTSEVKVPAGLIFSEASLLGLEIAIFSLCPHMVFSCWFIPLVSLPLVIRAPVLLDQGPILTISFNLNYLFKGPISKYSHILGYHELGLQHMNSQVSPELTKELRDKLVNCGPFYRRSCILSDRQAGQVCGNTSKDLRDLKQ